MADNDMETRASDAGDALGYAGSGRWMSRIIRLLMVLLVLGAGVGVSAYWLNNRPSTQRRPPAPEALLVEVTPVVRGDHLVTIQAMGTVVPATEVQLAAQVGGRIIEVNPEFVPGGHFKSGQRILQIESKDYELVLQQRSSDLARTQCDLKVELGQQSVASREYELLGETVTEQDRELVLRQPQLAMAEAAVAAAEAALEKAKLDLERTTVRSPFNAMVDSREVNLGSQVSAGTSLATLVGTDEFWVEVTVPVSHLRWLTVPRADGQAGSAVSVYHEPAWGPGVSRSGTVVRLKAGVEPQGRMARLLVSVRDPLSLAADSTDGPPMILGAYVRVVIDGSRLADVIRVPRSALHDGNLAWVMSADGTLDIREVTIAWSGNDHVYVSAGLSEGEALVTSDLAAPVQGMLVRTGKPGASEAAGDGEPQPASPAAGEEGGQ